jgi:hypothetical protein
VRRSDREWQEQRAAVCAVCGKPYRGHDYFGVCYRKAMNGEHNRGKTGEQTVRRER